MKRGSKNIFKDKCVQVGSHGLTINLKACVATLNLFPSEQNSYSMFFYFGLYLSVGPKIFHLFTNSTCRFCGILCSARTDLKNQN